ncbi:putative Multiple myeloma tumor-associated protein 2 [Glarea lozoyensis 74030]|uniref:Putative Multiple myeloma tumor-associated protein 2 n=1 Tax=Glarea lozoyensis (strain ATCC 74030 / MF5533) TaxID=1104152 RepID=H0ECH2_GLAL7|nr:putative Multiple myeloma tumor-associated protein 2 [Glarea lozoyensis 74030]
MDLLSSIRKSGSRGGVNFSWDEVQTSQHRENYLGHSLMAPVGRWQKGRDLNWYAKGDEEGKDGETADEKRIRERKEEIRRIKEAEEDAMSKALGLPVADRGVTGANAVSVGEVNRMVKEAGVGDEDEKEDVGKATGFGDFVGKVMNPEVRIDIETNQSARTGHGREAEVLEDVSQVIERGVRHRSAKIGRQTEAEVLKKENEITEREVRIDHGLRTEMVHTEERPTEEIHNEMTN